MYNIKSKIIHEISRIKPLNKYLLCNRQIAYRWSKMQLIPKVKITGFEHMFIRKAREWKLSVNIEGFLFRKGVVIGGSRDTYHEIEEISH